MPSDSKSPKMSLDNFYEAKDSLIKDLTEALELEIEMADFDIEEHEDEDLFDTPVVDSKAVVKLSPIVEELTGKKIKPEWIKSGGYTSVEEAIGDLVRQIELELSPSED